MSDRPIKSEYMYMYIVSCIINSVHTVSVIHVYMYMYMYTCIIFVLFVDIPHEY